MILKDADALKEKKEYSLERHENVVAVCEIDWQPTIDAVPVVRCKDCYFRCNEFEYGCAYSASYIEDDDYCSRGVNRKEVQDDA